jgi:DNA-binding NarL/FixJ family response regulator
MTDPLRVVIADDHPVFREGLRSLLSTDSEIEVVAEVASGADAVTRVDELQPDVVIMDLHMPGLDGVAATRDILGRSPHVAVLMLTMFDDDDSVFAAMRAGARGYLLKGASQDEIGRAIDAVAAGEAIFGPAVARRVLEQLGAPGAPATPFPGLTPRERQVLELLTEGLTTTAIGARLGLTPKTVSNHTSSIFTKLQVQSRAEAVARARRAGLGP